MKKFGALCIVRIRLNGSDAEILAKAIDCNLVRVHLKISTGVDLPLK